MAPEEIEAHVREAWRRVQHDDSKLLGLGRVERAVCFRLGLYLHQRLQGSDWTIDCEYNRQGLGGDSKLSTGGDKVSPDIAIHRRGEPALADNLLVVEVKTRWCSHADLERDRTKLAGFTSDPADSRNFQYAHGLLLVFAVDGSCQLKWFANGQRARQSTIPAHS